MRMTIATDEHGHLLGAIQHAQGKGQRDEPEVSVSFAPGARLREVEVGSELDMTSVTDVGQFHEALSRYAESGK